MSATTRERVTYLSNGRRKSLIIEYTHLDDGQYGWLAEVPSMVGVREYGASRAAVEAAVLAHFHEENRRLRRAAHQTPPKTNKKGPRSDDPLAPVPSPTPDPDRV